MRQLLFRMAAIAFGALALAGCVESENPILTDAQPAFGPRLRLQFYSLRKGYAHEPQQANYAWNGGLYAHAGGGMRDVSAFSVHAFENGDYIIQTVPARRMQMTEFALLHKLAEGVYQVIAISEDDADEATRVAYCKKIEKASCRIQTRDQLLAFARATAARNKDDGGLVIRLPDGSRREQPTRQRPPRR